MPAIKIWLGQEGLLLKETFIQEGKEKSKTTEGLLAMLSNRFMLHNNYIILTVQYQKIA